MFVYFENLLHIVVVICGCRCLFPVVDVEEDAWIVWMVAVARNNTTSGKISHACSDFMCLYPTVSCIMSASDEPMRVTSERASECGHVVS